MFDVRVSAAPLAAPGNLLLFMLGPATLSFGFQMFGRRQLMRESAKAVSAVIAVSSSFGLFATAFAGRAINLIYPVRLAALPRQVTAPLAIAIAGMLKADPSLAATIVVVTGVMPQPDPMGLGWLIAGFTHGVYPVSMTLMQMQMF